MFCALLFDDHLGTASRGDIEQTEKMSFLSSQVLNRESPHATEGHRGSARFGSVAKDRREEKA